MKQIQKKQDGSAHIIIVIVVLVLLVGAIGFVVWRSMNKKTGTTNNTMAAANAECAKENDKDICKFLTSWKEHQQYRMTSTDEHGKSVFEVNGGKSHITMSGHSSYEVITIDKTTYTKAGDVWYKQTVTDPKQDVTQDYKEDFKEPATDDSKPEENKTVYKSLGKEACGNLMCFKYEVVDSAQADQKQFIWFDDKDYQLRRGRTEGPDGVTEQTYEYGNVSVNVPSPVKELAPGQYIVPGQSEPMNAPQIPENME